MKIFKKGTIQFDQDGWQVVGLRYEFENNSYIVTATAYDEYGYNKLNSLLKTSIAVFIISILFIYFAGVFLSKKAFGPISEMTAKVRKISAHNLDMRLPNGKNKDELFELADTFNAMLDRLERSFDAQKHFVSNISHELRTPLAAIIAELELSLSKERERDAYKGAITNSLSDARKIVRLSNNLLDMAKASYDPSEITFKKVRIDEILLDARHQVQQAFPNYKIDIHFGFDLDEDHQISIIGNPYLLKVAFVNIFENGCKFSNDHRCKVSINSEKEKLELEFCDNGIGISEIDLKNIFTPFYRGDNQKFADGNGIGLPLSRKIITLHKGSIFVKSVLHKETAFKIIFPTL